jgi:ribosomal protein S10
MQATIQQVPSVRSAVSEVWHFFTGGGSRSMLRIHKDVRQILAKAREFREELDQLARSNYQFRTRTHAELDDLASRLRKLELELQARAKRDADAVARAIVEGGKRMDAELRKSAPPPLPKGLPPLPAVLVPDVFDDDEETSMLVLEAR